MIFRLSDPVAAAMLDALEASIGAAPTLEFWTGAPPLTAAATPTGVLLASGALPADWLTPAAARVKSQAGTWSGLSVAAGVAGYFRVSQAGVGFIVGDITPTGAGGALTVADVNVVVAQALTITSFTLTDGNP